MDTTHRHGLGVKGMTGDMSRPTDRDWHIRNQPGTLAFQALPLVLGSSEK